MVWDRTAFILWQGGMRQDCIHFYDKMARDRTAFIFMARWHETGLHPFLWQDGMRQDCIHFYGKIVWDRTASIFMTRWHETGLHSFKTSQHKTGAHPFYIGMYIHIYTHIYVHIYTSQKECLHIFFTRKQATKTLRLAVTMSLSQNHLNILWRSRFLSHHFPGSWLCHRHLPGHPRVWHRASWMDWTYGHVAFGVSFHDLQCRFVKAGAKHGSIRKKKQTTNNKQHLEKQDLHSKHMFLFIIHESTKTASALIPQSCFFSFNWRPGCWMNGRNPLINYAGSLACYPFGALAVLCLLGVSKYFKVVWGGDLG